MEQLRAGFERLTAGYDRGVQWVLRKLLLVGVIALSKGLLFALLGRVFGYGNVIPMALGLAIMLAIDVELTLYLLIAVFRMGWMSQFLSKAVITGFLFGAAIEVVIGELPKITGTSVEGSNAWQKLFSWFGGLSEFHGPTLLVGLISLVVIFGVRRIAPKIPGALVLVVGGLIASAVFGLGEHGLATKSSAPALNP